MTGAKFRYGVINVNKDKGYTSHDIVQIIRRSLNIKKVGHTGTLDPDVTGVLPICIGNATRVAEYIQNQGKTYKGVMRIGVKTDTLDMSGKVIKSSDNIPDLKDILISSEKFIGEIMQIPPMFSAVHHKGQRLHELARQGIVVERPPRKVNIYNLEILSYDYPFVSFICKCSKGTYIRTLIDDLGEEIESYASLESLERIKVGNLKVESSFTLESIKEKICNEDFSFIIPMEECLDFDKIILDKKYFNKIINGINLITEIESSDKLYQIYCDKTFIGIGKVVSRKQFNYIKMEKMLYQEM